MFGIQSFNYLINTKVYVTQPLAAVRSAKNISPIKEQEACYHPFYSFNGELVWDWFQETGEIVEKLSEKYNLISNYLGFLEISLQILKFQEQKYYLDISCLK